MTIGNGWGGPKGLLHRVIKRTVPKRYYEVVLYGYGGARLPAGLLQNSDPAAPSSHGEYVNTSGRNSPGCSRREGRGDRDGTGRRVPKVGGDIEYDDDMMGCPSHRPAPRYSSSPNPLPRPPPPPPPQYPSRPGFRILHRPPRARPGGTPSSHDTLHLRLCSVHILHAPPITSDRTRQTTCIRLTWYLQRGWATREHQHVPPEHMASACCRGSWPDHGICSLHLSETSNRQRHVSSDACLVRPANRWRRGPHIAMGAADGGGDRAATGHLSQIAGCSRRRTSQPPIPACPSAPPSPSNACRTCVRGAVTRCPTTTLSVARW